MWDFESIWVCLLFSDPLVFLVKGNQKETFAVLGVSGYGAPKKTAHLVCVWSIESRKEATCLWGEGAEWVSPF